MDKDTISVGDLVRISSNCLCNNPKLRTLYGHSNEFKVISINDFSRKFPYYCKHLHLNRLSNVFSRKEIELLKEETFAKGDFL